MHYTADTVADITPDIELTHQTTIEWGEDGNIVKSNVGEVVENEKVEETKLDQKPEAPVIPTEPKVEENKTPEEKSDDVESTPTEVIENTDSPATDTVTTIEETPVVNKTTNKSK